MKKIGIIVLAFVLIAGSLAFAEGSKEKSTTQPQASESESSTGMQSENAQQSEKDNSISFVEVSWTDIASTTAATQIVLDALGYNTESTTVSVPIAYEGMKEDDADVFLGNWMPSMKSIAEPYFDSGEVVNLSTNLIGAKYTLAVPTYVAEGGLQSFADIAKYRDKLNGKIYGIEAGNDGNQLIQKMIDENAFGLKGFTLVESSEAGMLAQVKGAIPQKQWIVFLGWEPHPMNAYFDMTYLKGGDDYFGPNYGAATVHTNVRKGFTEDYPNVTKMLKNQKFTLKMENEIMASIDNGATPHDAALKWLKENPSILNGWLEGVTTADGKPGLPAVKKALGVN